MSQSEVLNDAGMDGKHIERIRFIARRSAENASAALSKWLKTDITLRVLDVKMTTPEEIGAGIKLNEDVVIAAASDLVGDIKGHFLFMFRMEDAFKMSAMVMKKPFGAAFDVDEIVRSVVLETCNIVGSAFSNYMVNMLRIKLLPSAPSACCDLGGAVMGNILIEYASLGEKIFFIETEYTHEDSKFEGYFFMLPTLDSLPVLFENMD